MLVSTKARISLLLNSPIQTLSGLGRSLLYRFRVPAQVERLREITRKDPLFLQIETVNICNSACIFCAYPCMTRKKGIMDPGLFEKIIRDFAGMGGVSLNLTPIMGDILLDPHLLERLNILKNYPEIRQITFTTNGIALERYSDQEIRRLLEDLSRIQLSIGGLDRETYRTMYNVDRFPTVKKGMERLLEVRKTVSNPAEISFAFRTNDSTFETRFKAQLDSYRRQGVKISHMWIYGNYSGAVEKNEEKGLEIYSDHRNKHQTCVFPCLNMVVCRDGTITACCADFEGKELILGHAEKETLTEVWTGEKRKALLESFGSGDLPPICRSCSGYQPDTVFTHSCFKNFQPHQPLPPDFFLF